MRLFVAVPVPEYVQKALSMLLKEAFPFPVEASWSKPEQLHITLKFLGQIDEKRLEEIQESLAGVAQQASRFELHLSGLGVFPPQGKPKTLWAGIDQGIKPLRELASQIAAILVPFGFPMEERVYTPHITLARLRNQSNMDILHVPLVKYKNTFIGSLHVSSFLLLNSRLTSSGAEYTVIEAFDLKG